MAIERKTKLDLSKYDVDWKGCFVMFKASSFGETLEMQAKLAKIERDSYKVERFIKKSNNADEDASQLMEDLDKLSAEQLEIMISLATKAFISGKVFDGTLRDMKIEDIKQFDFEVLGDMVGLVTGKVSGK